MPISDARSLGRSRDVPYIYGEPAKTRHDRRKEAALLHQGRVKQWCDNRGVTFTLGNDDHHWSFRKGKERADWWPSTAKLVLNQRWNEGLHCHDAAQMLRVLAGHFTEAK